MQTVNKQALFNHLADYGIEPDEVETAMVEKILGGWSKRRPIKLAEISDENDANLTIASERHYMKEIGGGSKSCTSYKCRESIRYSGENMPFMDIEITRFILDQTGIFRHSEHCADNTPAIKEAMNVDPEKERSFQSMSDMNDLLKNGLLSLDVCTKAVKSLRESIIKTLDDCGLFWDSLVTDKEKNEEFTTKLDSILARAERRRRIDAFKKLAQRIDPEMTEILEITGVKTPAAYNWLCAKGDEKISQNRKEAARRYPLLMNVLTGAHYSSQASYYHRDFMFGFRMSEDYYERRRQEQAIEEDFKNAYRTLSECIDTGEDIEDALVNAVFKNKSLSPLTISAVSMCETVPENFDFKLFAKSLDYIDQLPPEKMPQNSDDLADFIECYKRAATLSFILNKPVNSIMDEADGNWPSFLNATISMKACKSVGQWVDDTYKYIVIPQWMRQLQPQTLQKIATESSFSDFENERSFSTYRELIKTLEIAEPQAYLGSVPATEIVPYALSWGNHREDILKTLRYCGYSADEMTLSWTSALPKLRIEDSDGLTFTVSALESLRDIETAMVTVPGFQISGDYYFEKLHDAAKGKAHFVMCYSDSGKDRSPFAVFEIYEDNDYRGNFSNLNFRNIFSENVTKAQSIARQYSKDALSHYQKHRMPDSNYNAIAQIKRMALADMAGVDIYNENNIRAAFETMTSFLPPSFPDLGQTAAYDVRQSTFFEKLVRHKLESKDHTPAPDWPPDN